jgi:outer membrane protein assembly factor BamD (BamD/ComL family)
LTRSNPPYEILFLSQLNTAGAVDFANEAAVAKTEKTLQSLLKDPKNAEYKDRILFEIGGFEVKRGRLQQGLDAYKKSLAATTKSQQKAATYLQMGKVYYERLQDYASAALYYDSASQILPTSSPDYDAVKRQAGILGEFAEEQAKIKSAERLLQLYAMNDAERKKALEKEIAEEKQTIDRQAKAAQQEAGRTGTASLPASNFPAASPSSNTWYFYNVQTVANGRTAFARTWGNIPLADNWRLSDKVRDSQPDEIIQATPTANTPEKGRENQPQDTDRYAAVKTLEKRLAEIPADEAEAKQVRLALADALYQTGKMYFQVLNEPQKARANLERFVQLTPDHPKVPEALYTIIRLCSEQKDCQPDVYKRRLSDNYPESSYAQLLNKSSGDENAPVTDANSLQVMAEAVVVKAYAEAYELYRSGKYSQALEQFNQMEARYPGNPLGEQIAMLKILSRLALEPASAQAENDLKNFIAAARRTELVEMAKAVLQKIEERKKP